MSVYSDHQSEASILNAIQYHERSRKTIFSRLTKDDFSHNGYKASFEILSKSWNDNNFSKEIIKEANLNEVEASCLPWQDSIEILRKATYRRACHKVIHMMVTAVEDPTNSNEYLACMGLKIHSKYTGGTLDAPRPMKSIISSLMGKLESGRSNHVSWCIDKLDTARLESGVLAVVGARPSVGKTAFCCSSMIAMSDQGIASGMICIEMDDIQIASRLISQKSGLSYEDIWRKNYSEGQLSSLQEGVARVGESKIHLYCGRHVTPEDIECIATKWVKYEGVKVLFVDYIQRIKHGKADSERLRVGKSSYAMKLLARKLGIPIVICSQLNRDSDNKRPTLRDLKESGDIEQDADIVYLLDRQIDGQEFKRDYQKCNEVGNVEPVDMDGKAAVQLAKNRNGRTGITYLDFEGETMRFHDDG